MLLKHDKIFWCYSINNFNNNTNAEQGTGMHVECPLESFPMVMV